MLRQLQQRVRLQLRLLKLPLHQQVKPPPLKPPHQLLARPPQRLLKLQHCQLVKPLQRQLLQQHPQLLKLLHQRLVKQPRQRLSKPQHQRLLEALQNQLRQQHLHHQYQPQLLLHQKKPLLHTQQQLFQQPWHQKRTAHGTASASLPARTRNTARDTFHLDVVVKKLLNVTCACAKTDGSRIQKPESASLRRPAAKDNAHTTANHTEKEKHSGREIASSVIAEMDVNTVSLDCVESHRMTVMREDNDSSMYQDHAASVHHTTLPSPHQLQLPHQSLYQPLSILVRPPHQRQ